MPVHCSPALNHVGHLKSVLCSASTEYPGLSTGRKRICERQLPARQFGQLMSSYGSNTRGSDDKIFLSNAEEIPAILRCWSQLSQFPYDSWIKRWNGIIKKTLIPYPIWVDGSRSSLAGVSFKIDGPDQFSLLERDIQEVQPIDIISSSNIFG